MDSPPERLAKGKCRFEKVTREALLERRREVLAGLEVVPLARERREESLELREEARAEIA